jgi:hypothetical protein
MISKIILACVLCAGTTAFAQTGGGPSVVPDIPPEALANAELPRVNLLAFTSVANFNAKQLNAVFERGLPTLFVRNGKNLVPVKLEAGGISTPVEYVGKSPISLLIETKSAEGAITHVPVASIPFGKDDETVPAVIGYYADGFRVKPIPFGSKVLPEGNLFLLNLGSKPVAYKIASSEGVLASGQNGLVGLKQIKDYRLPVQLFYDDAANGWKGLHSSMHIPYGTERMLYIVVESADPELGWSLYTTDLPPIAKSNPNPPPKS